MSIELPTEWDRICCPGSGSSIIKEMSMQCPKCDKPLAEVYLREVPIEQCQTCEGIWLDSGEFQLIVEREKAEEGWLSRAFKSWLAGTKKEKELQKTLNNSSTPPAEPPSMPMES